MFQKLLWVTDFSPATQKLGAMTIVIGSYGKRSLEDILEDTLLGSIVENVPIPRKGKN